MSLSLPIAPLPGAPVVVGYSGGMDSGVLLSLLAQDDTVRASGLRALHVHHGLHADADAWATLCARTCAALDVPLTVIEVAVDPRSRLGVEGAARQARHRAFADALGNGEILALAHHRDDQAETFLLRALRGSGVDGLAAMAPWRTHGRGWLWRPLLAQPRDALHAEALRRELHWIEDPANADARFDRTFLRTHVLPLLEERWPHAQASLARSAALAAQAADLLAAEDAALLAGMRLSPDVLACTGLRALPAARRARLLRHWIAGLGLPPLPANGVDHIQGDLLRERAPAGACFEWAGARVQRWRQQLHAGLLGIPLPDGFSCQWDGVGPLDLPTGDTLELRGAAGFEASVRVHARQGGERIALPGRVHRHALQHVLQQRAVPPWTRRRMPLLSSVDGEVLAAGDAILSAQLEAWLQARGAALSWRRQAMA